MAAALLLGHGDTHISHHLQVHSCAAMLSLFQEDHIDERVTMDLHEGADGRRQASSAGGNTVTATPCETGPPGAHDVLRGGSRRPDDPLQDGHALSSTHGHSLHPRIRVPQFLKKAPVRPTGTACPELQHDYALFALSNFCSHVIAKELDGDTLWEQLLCW
jgi:hypothetical protein